MPCVTFKNGIVCFPNMRKFRYKSKFYFIEEGGWGRAISDLNGDMVDPEACNGRMRSKLYKEMTKGV